MNPIRKQRNANFYKAWAIVNATKVEKPTQAKPEEKPKKALDFPAKPVTL